MVSSVAPEHQQKFEDSGNQIGYEVKYRERLQFSLQWAADTKKQFQKPEDRKKEWDMWLFYAIGSAFFAGVTSILAKCGIRKTDSTVATAVRTVVVLIFSWIMVLISGSFDQITSISGYTFVFLILSGAATGASWLCYFKALQTGDINKVVPIDKSSTVLTIILALIFLHEGISLPKAVAVVAIAAGILLMKFQSKGQALPILEILCLQLTLDTGAAIDIRPLPIGRYDHYPAICGGTPEAHILCVL